MVEAVKRRAASRMWQTNVANEWREKEPGLAQWRGRCNCSIRGITLFFFFFFFELPLKACLFLRASMMSLGASILWQNGADFQKQRLKGWRERRSRIVFTSILREIYNFLERRNITPLTNATMKLKEWAIFFLIKFQLTLVGWVHLLEPELLFISKLFISILICIWTKNQQWKEESYYMNIQYTGCFIFILPNGVSMFYN